VEATDLESIETLGRGAYGVVEKMRHHQSDTVMAVKVQICEYFRHTRNNESYLVQHTSHKKPKIFDHLSPWLKFKLCSLCSVCGRNFIVELSFTHIANI